MWLHIGDYRRDTNHLTSSEHGSYLLLLMALWTAGGQLPMDPAVLARSAGVTPRRWGKLSKTLLPFFASDGKVMIHKRLLLELERATETLAASRDKALAGGLKSGFRRRQGSLDIDPQVAGFAGAAPAPKSHAPGSGVAEITPELRAILNRWNKKRPK